MALNKREISIIVAALVVVAIVLIVYFAVLKPRRGPHDKPLLKATVAPAAPPRPGSAGPANNQEGFGSTLKDSIGADNFAAQRMHRDHMVRSAQNKFSEKLRSNPEQMSARAARMMSVRGVDKFGGPREGYGWSPSPLDEDTPHGGWHDNQSAAHGECSANCAENCNGPACEAYCADRCRGTALLQVSA